MLIGVSGRAVRAQTVPPTTCTVTSPSTCPTTGIPTGWTGVANVLDGTNNGQPGWTGQNYHDFMAGAGTSYATIVANNANTNTDPIAYSANLWSLGANFMIADANNCGGASPASTCLYNNWSNARKVVDKFLLPQPGGMGAAGIDINPDLGPMFQRPEYAAICAAYSAVIGFNACFTPTTYASILTHQLYTFDQTIPYIHSQYPSAAIRISPTFSTYVLSTCKVPDGSRNLMLLADRTLANMDACLVPLFQTFAAAYWLSRVDGIHEVTGIYAIQCGACDFLSSPANVDTFLSHVTPAIKSTSLNASVHVGAGAIIPDMGGATWRCPNSGGSLNYWCDYITVDPFLDYVGIDVYPNGSAPTSSFASTMGNRSSTGLTYSTFFNRYRSIAAYYLDLFVNESSMLRWGPTTGGTPPVEAGTNIGSAWQTWNDNGANFGWINAVANVWAHNMGIKGFSIFDCADLVMASTDVNNTKAIYGSDGYMQNLVTALNNGITTVSPAGLMYGSLSPANELAPSSIMIQGYVTMTGRITIQ